MTYCQSKGGIPYFETSAKEAINVEQAFEGTNCFLKPVYNMGFGLTYPLLQSLHDKRSHKKMREISTPTSRRRYPSTWTKNEAAAHANYHSLIFYGCT